MTKIFTIAILSALAFIGLASFSDVYAWPLIFPVAGGIIAMIVSNSHVKRSYGHVFVAGLAGAVLATILGVVILKISFEEGFDSLSENQQQWLNGLLGAIFLVSWLIGNGLGAFFAKKKN